MRNFSDKGAIRLSQGFSFAAVNGKGLLAISEDGADLLGGEIFNQLVRIIERGQDPADLMSTYPPEEIHSALARMEEFGLTQSRERTSNPFADSFWDAAHLVPPIHSTVDLVSFLPFTDSWLKAALEANGLVVDQSAERLLAVTDDYLKPEIGALSKSERPWLLVKPIGHTIWLGPLFGPGRSVCCNCMAHWISMNRWAQAAVWSRGSATPLLQGSIASLPSTVALAAGLIATAATMWAARGAHPTLENAILTLDTRDLTWHRHRIRPLPGCEMCPPELSQTVPLRDFVSGICGIVSRLSIRPAPTGSFHVANAQVAPPLRHGLQGSLRPFTVCGRGSTEAIAEESCVGEAIERYSAIFQGSESRTLASVSELGATAVPPSELFMFSESQYQNRDVWNRESYENFAVPCPVEAEMKIEWTCAASLTTGVVRHVPSAYCFLWYESSTAEDIYSADSMGCAAGPTITRAIESALLEAIERDAVSIWWDNRVRRPAWAVETLSAHELVSFRDSLAHAGRDLFLLDITTDIGVPVCAAVAARMDGSHPYFTAAAALDPRTAALRAAGELAQMLSFTPAELSGECRNWITTARVGEHEYLTPTGETAPPGVIRSLEDCLTLLTRVGLDPLLLDLTRPEIGVPAVRVIVPGIRHPWRRHAPGRLYDVPVRLGWLARSLAESELNPTPCVI